MTESERYSALIDEMTAAWRTRHRAEPDEPEARAIRRKAYLALRREQKARRGARAWLRPAAVAVSAAVVVAAVVALLMVRDRAPQPSISRGLAGQQVLPLQTECADGQPDVAYRYSFTVRPAADYRGATAVVQVSGRGGGWAGFRRNLSAQVGTDGRFSVTLGAECRSGGQIDVTPISVGGRSPDITP